MPGQSHRSVDRLIDEVKAAADDGVRSVLLFGIPETKDAVGSEAWDAGAAVQRACEALSAACPDTTIITDVCLCEYTDHGHCGVIDNEQVDNDATLERLAEAAVSHARAGAHVIAPSDMMDGRVGAIRDALDAEGFKDVAILSYAAKYASAYYGPFRDAADSEPQFGDRRSYQMDPANTDEALREVALDVAEGADMVMVKPGMPYLDIVRRVKEAFGLPTFAYQVSGEYAMLRGAADRGWLDWDKVILESILCFKRAGADGVLTYAAPQVARLLGA